MGGGPAKTHESFTVAPTAPPDEHPGFAAGDGSGLYVVQSGELPQISNDKFEDLLAKVGQAENFEQLKEAVAEASQVLDEAAAQGMPAQLIADGKKELHQATTAWLSELPPEQLTELAAAEGFEHPSLTGLNSKGQHPLVHWLDPSYPPGLPSKAQIQAKASERYAILAGGGTINGMTLADVQAAEANLPAASPAVGGEGWAATPGDVVAAQATLTDALAAYNSANPVSAFPVPFGQQKVKEALRREALGPMLDAENHLATAQCPELGAHLEAVKGSARGAVDAAIGDPPPGYLKDTIQQRAAEASETGGVAPGTDKMASASEALKLMRASTPAAERDAIAAAVTERSNQWDKFEALRDQYLVHDKSAQGGGLELAGVGDAAGQAELATFATTAGDLAASKSEVTTWAPTVMGYQDLVGKDLYTTAGPQLTGDFKTWSKGQPLHGMRATAEQLGLSHADAAVATRGQVQNYIAGTWDPSIDNKALSAGVGAGEAKAAKKAAANAAALAATPHAPWVQPQNPVAAPAPPASPVTPITQGATKTKLGSFGQRQRELVEALKHHAASVGSLPPRPPAAEVAAWEFEPTKGPTNLGGQHTKSFWRPKGEESVWMAKGDGHNNGARAEGEATASEVYNRVGVPSVPVYARKVGTTNTPGVMQPLLQGATNLSPSPSSWSQPDVDALVRNHVAAHAVGDHDGKTENQLRTTAGGIVPCDHGCAFRDFGSDKLSTSYSPRCVTVHQEMYQAGKTGGLAKGVRVRPEAALPVIKAFEAIPDSEYRAMLHKVAHRGAQEKVTWYKAMRARAATKHGTAAPSDSQVAEAFLDHAVERKNGLRKSFADFFRKEGFADGAAKLEMVA